jgi:hypothetical protein
LASISQTLVAIGRSFVTSSQTFKSIGYPQNPWFKLNTLIFPFPFLRTRPRTIFNPSQNLGREISSRKLVIKNSGKLRPSFSLSSIHFFFFFHQNFSFSLKFKHFFLVPEIRDKNGNLLQFPKVDGEN